MAARATLSKDLRHVTLARTAWSETFPVGDLPRKLAFYRRLRDAPPPKDRVKRNGEAFVPDVTALEKVEKVARALGVL